MAENSEALEVSHIGFSFESKRRAVHVLEDVSFRVLAGECVAIVGASGVGKSTLINLIAGFLVPTVGEIRAFGDLVDGPCRSRLAVFQESALWPWLSMEANLALGLNKGAPSFRADLENAMRLLQRVGLADALRAYPGQLSGGMQKRAELVRAISAKPRILLLDEALRSVDIATKQICEDLIEEFCVEQGAAVVMVSHDPEEVARLAKSVVMLAGQPALVSRIVELSKFHNAIDKRQELQRVLGHRS